MFHRRYFFSIQDGGRKSKEHNFEIFQHFRVMSVTKSFYFDQKHDPKSNFVKKVKNGGSIQDGGSKYML
jgi:hypothetical protein